VFVLIIREGPSAPPDPDALKEILGKEIALNQETEDIAIFECTNKGLKVLAEQADHIIVVGDCQIGDIEPELTLPKENANEMVAEAIAALDQPSEDEADVKPVE